MPIRDITNPPSLRSRYLKLASLVIITLLICTSVTSWYIEKAADRKHEAHEIYESIEESIFELREALSTINTTVTTMLTQPEIENGARLEDALLRALNQISQLSKNPDIKTAQINVSVALIEGLLNELHTKVDYLLQNKDDRNWVYPIFPHISNDLARQHQIFSSAIEISIDEYNLDIRDIDPTYFLLIRARDNWQKMIMSFRASMVQFTGLNSAENLPEDIQVRTYHDEVDRTLIRLQKNVEAGIAGIQTEESLAEMIDASKRWNEKWLSIRELQDSISWRGDIDYLNNEIKPTLVDIGLAMQELGIDIHNWSSSETEKLTNVTQLIDLGLWVLSILAILFVLVVYLMIERFVIQPAVRISSSLEDKSDNHHLQIEDRSSQEIFQLTKAFNTLHKQIHQRQADLEHQALHDALTGLPNRVLLNDRLYQAINTMKRINTSLAVLLIDLDRFKDINDTLGHHIGDQLLTHVAERLENTVRNSDTVARLGGDEFAIIAPNIKSEEALVFSHKIISALKDVFVINNQNLHIGASVGIAMFPRDGDTSHALLRRADTAMYAAKYNNFGATMYKPSLDKNTPDSLSLVGDLHNAIEQDRGLTICYQPQISASTNDVVQIEALLRWQHPNKGTIQPEDIIKLAEHTGVIQELTTWIMSTAMEEYMEYLFNKNIRLAINLSAWNLQDPNLPTTIKTLLKLHNMPANMLTLEITETSMMNDHVHARSAMQELSDMGIILSIDDYGTGFSSLSYLKLLPVDELKIDKSFIIDMLDDENDAIIVRSTIELAHNLGYKVIGEGVENQTAQEKLVELGCDYIQGYHISQPLDIVKLLYWIEENNTARKKTIASA